MNHESIAIAARSYAEEFVRAMNELAGNFTEDEEHQRRSRAPDIPWSKIQIYLHVAKSSKWSDPNSMGLAQDILTCHEEYE